MSFTIYVGDPLSISLLVRSEIHTGQILSPLAVRFRVDRGVVANSVASQQSRLTDTPVGHKNIMLMCSGITDEVQT